MHGSRHAVHAPRHRRRAWTACFAVALTALAGFVAVGEERLVGDAIDF